MVWQIPVPLSPSSGHLCHCCSLTLSCWSQFFFPSVQDYWWGLLTHLQVSGFKATLASPYPPVCTATSVEPPPVRTLTLALDNIMPIFSFIFQSNLFFGLCSCFQTAGISDPTSSRVQYVPSDESTVFSPLDNLFFFRSWRVGSEVKWVRVRRHSIWAMLRLQKLLFYYKTFFV